MKSSVLVALAATSLLAFAADDRNPGVTPPVLRPLEPADSSVFQLPGPAPVTPRIRKVPIAKPVPKAMPVKAKLVLAPLPPLPYVPPAAPPVNEPALPASPLTVASVPATLPAAISASAVEPPKPAMPPEAAQEMAFYCQKHIGQWTEADARKLLGTPLRSRAALDDRKKANGRIYAFRDPTSRYRELELDFDSKGGNLRTVFVYPHRMTWQDVRRRWHGDVSAADAPQGRKFYSYANRRLDVLVDAQGTVISLGLY
jgi:hypothetical protein